MALTKKQSMKISKMIDELEAIKENRELQAEKISDTKGDLSEHQEAVMHSHNDTVDELYFALEALGSIDFRTLSEQESEKAYYGRTGHDALPSI